MSILGIPDYNFYDVPISISTHIISIYPQALPPIQFPPPPLSLPFYKVPPPAQSLPSQKYIRRFRTRGFVIDITAVLSRRGQAPNAFIPQWPTLVTSPPLTQAELAAMDGLLSKQQHIESLLARG